MRRRVRSARGGTLLEVLFAALVGATVVGAAALVATAGVKLHSSASDLTELTGRGHRTLRRAAAELRHARGDSLAGVATTPGWSGSVTFDRLEAVGASDGAPAWSNCILRWALAPGETDDGADENGDGLIDEGVLELVHDAGSGGETVVILARGVPELAEGESVNGSDDNGNGLVDEPGFHVSRDGDLLTLRLTLVATDGLTDTFETTVGARN